MFLNKRDCLPFYCGDRTCSLYLDNVREVIGGLGEQLFYHTHRGGLAVNRASDPGWWDHLSQVNCNRLMSDFMSTKITDAF